MLYHTQRLQATCRQEYRTDPSLSRFLCPKAEILRNHIFSQCLRRQGADSRAWCLCAGRDYDGSTLDPLQPVWRGIWLTPRQASCGVSRNLRDHRQRRVPSRSTSGSWFQTSHTAWLHSYGGSNAVGFACLKLLSSCTQPVCLVLSYGGISLRRSDPLACARRCILFQKRLRQASCRYDRIRVLWQ